MSLRSLARAAALGAVMFAFATGVQPADAHAVERGDDVQMVAMFGDLRIDLAGDWRGARVCSVWRAQSHVECFADQAQADRRVAALRSTLSKPQLLAACSTPLKLFDDANNKGRTLQYFDRGYWQNIPLDFNDKTSSYVTGSCTSHLAEHSGGGGYWYPGYTGPNHIETWMGSAWNDRVSSIKND